MKRTGLLIFVCTAILPAASATDADYRVATVVSAATLQATADAAPADQVSDQRVVHVESAEGRLGIGVVHRPVLAAGAEIEGIVHHKQSEVYRVMSGSGTLVTSAELAGAEPLDPEGQIVRTLTGPSSVGTIDGTAQSRRIGAGDVVIIPAGVAHGFSEITEAITYMVVRIDPERLVSVD